MSSAVINNFIEITGTDRSTAMEFLEMANGDIDTAISLFFEDPHSSRPSPQVHQPPPSIKPPSRPSQGKPHDPKPQPQTPISVPIQPDRPQGHIVDDIIDLASNRSSQQSPEPQPDKLEKHLIYFWKDGFVVDDGEYRKYDDPANAEFLDSVKKGRIPREFYKPGIEVDVEIENNRDQDYKPKPKPWQPFSGQAHSLASNTPSQTQNQSKPPPSATKTDFSRPGEKPTRVRVRLPDGQTITFTVSPNAKVSELNKYIKINRPDLNGKQIQLSQTIPKEVISNINETIKQAGLSQSSIVADFV